MAKTRSWSVKGIDGETRDLARDAARVSGMTIGAWIDQAILKAKHGELPTSAPADARAESIVPATSRQPDLPLSTAPVTSLTEPPTAAPQDQPAKIEDPSATPAGVEVAAGPDTEAASSDVVPSSNVQAGVSVTSPEIIVGDPSAEPRPLPPQPGRKSAGRYVVVGIVFTLLLGGGAWLLAELSSPDRTPAPQKIADATPPMEAPPAPPAASSSTTPVALPSPTTSSPNQREPGLGAPPADLPDAIRNTLRQAQAGDAQSQYSAGMFYLSGRSGDRNPAEAAKWFERAAEQGSGNAQFNLGVLHQRGDGVAQNDKRAFFWFQKAAEQNFPQAQHNLATSYAEGRGIARNYPKAAEWFAKSAAAGLGQSQYSLGELHERGLITGQPDRTEARRWYERALAQGDGRAAARLAALDAPAATATVAAPSAVAIGRAEIRQIQTLLGRMNFDPGPADGQMGSRTADAIRLYQKFAGLDEDGAPSRELLEDLRAVAETMSKDG